MSKIACPNRNLKEWSDLVSAIGEDNAFRIFAENSFDIPTLKEVNKKFLPIINMDIQRVLATIDEQIASLNQKANALRKSSTDVTAAYTTTKINEIQDTISKTLKKRDELQYSKAVGELIRNAKEDLENINEYVSNKNNRKDPNFLGKLIQYKKFIQEHQKIAVPDFSYGKRVVNDNINAVSNLIANVSRDIYKEFEIYTSNLVKDKTSNPKLVQDPAELAKLMKEAVDLGTADTWFGDVYSSPEALLANVTKLFRDAQQELFDRNDKFENKFKVLGNRLAKAMGGKATYDFMIEKGGRYLQRTSTDYHKKDNEITQKNRDLSGQYMEYNKIVSLENSTPEQLAHNVKIQKLKSEIREWKSSEIIDEETGTVTDGKNHKFTDEFKITRAIHQKLDNDRGFWEWVRKEGISDEDYNAFLKNNFQPEKETWVAVQDDGEYKGRVALKKLTFHKNELIEVTDQWVNKKYSDLMNDTSKLGELKKEFYNEYIAAFETGHLTKLPTTVRRKMIGRLPVVMKNFTDAATGRGEGFFKTASKQFRRYFSNDLNSKAPLMDANGFITNDIPIFYVADLKSQERIDKLTIERDKFVTTDPKYIELNELINRENKKLDEADVNTDLVESLIKFNAMAENYEVMKNLESSLLATKDIIEGRNYTKSNGGKVEGKLSNTAKVFQNWMNLVFYQADEADNSTIALVAKRVQEFTSLKGVGFSPISAVNNYIMGRINQKIEAYGGVLFTKKNYDKTTALFNKDYLPNIFKELSFAKEDGSPYKIIRPYSKYSAVVRQFNFVSGKHEDGGLNTMAFAMSQGGEYTNQSRVGIAMIMDQMVKTSSGEEISLYDAYEYTEKDGSLKLKEGVKFDKNSFNTLRNKIKEANSHIHGRYSLEEKNVLSSHWLGRLGMQFHKWIYQSYNNRFKERFHEESLGVTVEGRYRTAWQFIQNMQQFNINVMANYNSMDEIGKANMRKNAAELVFFMSSVMFYQLFKGIADGLPEDDENMKRAFNYFAYQNSRQMSELTTFVNPIEAFKLAKSPVPILGTLKELTDIVTAGTGDFERGVYAGESKFLKELTDVIPALRQMNVWKNLQEQDTFFIKQ